MPKTNADPPSGKKLASARAVSFRPQQQLVSTGLNQKGDQSDFKSFVTKAQPNFPKRRKATKLSIQILLLATSMNVHISKAGRFNMTLVVMKCKVHIERSTWATR